MSEVFKDGDRNDEVKAAEEVINSLNYYLKYVLIRLRRHGDAIKYAIFLKTY